VVERYLDVIELKLNPRFSDAHKFESIMKKYIEIPVEAVERLVEGKYVEGSLHRDAWTGKIVFNAWVRRKPNNPNDKLVKKLPWGWVKESMQRIKVFGSFPKDVGTAQVMGLLEDHTRDAKNALIDRELIDFV
jgi:hypothetical protein